MWPIWHFLSLAAPFEIFSDFSLLQCFNHMFNAHFNAFESLNTALRSHFWEGNRFPIPFCQSFCFFFFLFSQVTPRDTDTIYIFDTSGCSDKILYNRKVTSEFQKESEIKLNSRWFRQCVMLYQNYFHINGRRRQAVVKSDIVLLKPKKAHTDPSTNRI